MPTTKCPNDCGAVDDLHYEDTGDYAWYVHCKNCGLIELEPDEPYFEPPEPQKATQSLIAFRVSPELKTSFKNQVEIDGTTVSAVLRDYVDKYANNELIFIEEIGEETNG